MTLLQIHVAGVGISHVLGMVGGWRKDREEGACEKMEDHRGTEEALVRDASKMGEVNALSQCHTPTVDSAGKGFCSMHALHGLVDVPQC